MAKKKTGLQIPANFVAFDRKVIVLDKSGVPWMIEPEIGRISLATIYVEGDQPKQSAVVKKRK